MTRHLIHIGFAKAGSTILQRWFRAHPQIAFARQGVLGLGTVFDISRGAVAEPGGIRLRVTSEESLATPHAAAGEQLVERVLRERVPQSGAGRVCAHLADLFPDAWILIVTRGFREIMVSGYSQYVKTGGTAPFFALDPDFGSAAHRSAGVWDYGRVIGLYQAAFPGRVIVLPYELLRDDSETFLATLEAAFGLDRFPLPPRLDNPSLSPVEMAWYPSFTALVTKLPAGPRLKRRLLRACVGAMNKGRWSRLAALCQKLRPRPLITTAAISDPVIARFAAKAAIFRDNPVYRPYAQDYLL